jgi:hypothetical protein
MSASFSASISATKTAPMCSGWRRKCSSRQRLAVGAAHEYDLTPFVPGARRAVGGDGDHMIAPSDPLFHRELASFLLTGA